MIREQKAMTIDKLFGEVKLTVVFIRWDSKLVSDTVSRKQIGRVPILVSNHTVEKLLSVPALPDGKGITVAEEIYGVLHDWNLTGSIRSLCYDNDYFRARFLHQIPKNFYCDTSQLVLNVFSFIYYFLVEGRCPPLLCIAQVQCWRWIENRFMDSYRMIQDYINVLAKDENRKQYLPQVIKEYKNEFSSATNECLTRKMKVP